MPPGRERLHAPGAETLHPRVVIMCIHRYLHQVGLGFHHTPEAEIGMPRGGHSSAPLEWQCTMGCKLAARQADGVCLFPWRPRPDGSCTHSVLEAYWFAAATVDAILNGDQPRYQYGSTTRVDRLRAAQGVKAELFRSPVEQSDAYRDAMEWLGVELARAALADRSFLGWLDRGRW